MVKQIRIKGHLRKIPGRRMQVRVRGHLQKRPARRR